MPTLNPLATDFVSCDVITKRNQEQSPLLRLPPELRNLIFGYVVGPPESSYMGSRRPRDFKLIRRIGGTCRQIRAETYLRYLSQQNFSFRCDSFRWHMALFTAEERNVICKIHVYQSDTEADGFWEAIGTLGSLEYLAFRLYRPRTNLGAVVSVSQARLERFGGRTVEFEALTEYELWPWEA